ncbi:hypothetical protein [Dyadobacter sp. NIV53]|uniref:hypothetical protein n=1 Tax=Dyadobacter sp. NIV53 TaxID=2861765 RepID=UPI001C88CBCA|nr:hypothetical protein [Dyadobacter sp. NIV53]
MNIDLFSARSAASRPLVIGFSKGRGFDEALEYIQIDRTNEYDHFANGGIPVFCDPVNNLKLVKVRSKDLPLLLLHNHIDIAFGSSVWFDESDSCELKLFTTLALQKCRLSVIGKNLMPIQEITSICSKFPNLTAGYISKNGLNAKVVIMEGCHEVALSLDMTDVIIDIIETGQTIERMNFLELECITTVSHGIWTRENDYASIRHLKKLWELV